ncbi:MAG TPA: hypothetical protein VLM79_06765 [Kofleriaceae bacterium]|nr:hypothetical protein [Kofleriaceae bacterium]
MRARWLVALVIPGVLLGLAPLASAQPRRGDGAGPAERRPVDSHERREQIKKRIRALRAYTLTDELQLDEQTAARLFPLLSRYDDDFDKLLEQRVNVQRRLKYVDTLKDPRAVDRLIDEAIANQRGFWDLQDKRIQALRKILTPAQTAKLLVALPALERRIENQLRKAIVQRRPGSSSPAAGALEEDDDPEADEMPPPKQRQRRREAPLAPRGPRSNAPGNTPECDPSAGPCR